MSEINRNLKIVRLDDLLIIVPTKNLLSKAKSKRLLSIDDLQIDKINLPTHGALGVKGLVKRCLATKGCYIELRPKTNEKVEIYLVFKSKSRTMEKAVSKLNMGQMVLLGIVLDDLK